MSEKRTIGNVTTSATAGSVLAGAVSVIAVWLLGEAGVNVPEHVASAFTVVIGAIGALAGGWIVKPGSGDHRG